MTTTPLHSESSIRALDEANNLLEEVYAQAESLQSSDDPETLLRELLQPVRDYIERIIEDKDERKTDAATRIQALVRGASGRHQLMREKSMRFSGTKVLRKYVLKYDRFPNCHVLSTPDGEIAPNFRRVPGTPFYGSAQPSFEGIKKILRCVSTDGFSNVVWVNLREEAVIYVDGNPYTARRSAKINENDLVPGITGHTIQVLETSLKTSLQEQLKIDNRFEYWHELELHENELQSAVVDPSQVMTLPEVFDLQHFADDPEIHVKSLSYYRLPIERENAPEHADVDRYLHLLYAALPDTAFVFNCQMGKRRTTTAMVLGSLCWGQKNIKVSDLKAQAEQMNTERISYEKGDFAVIRELQARCPMGRESKVWVDQVIDQCGRVCNLRTVINEYRELSMAEGKPAKRTYYLHHALSFLERYFYLIVLGAYMLTAPESRGSFPDGTLSPPRTSRKKKTFSHWIHHHPYLFGLLDDLGGVKYRFDKVLKQTSVIKEDHFPGLVRIPFEIGASAPNFRRIDSHPIFGVAQCLEHGIHDVLAYLKRGGFEKVIWINLREEAVIYVAGRPFVMRDSKDILTNIEYPGIEVDEITQIEAQLRHELHARIKKANGLFLFWHEPREFVSEETIEHVHPETEIKTLSQIYQEIGSTSQVDVKYARVPVSDETAPEEKDLDDIVRLVVPGFVDELHAQAAQALATAHNGSKTAMPKLVKRAVVCNCQMGRGRTTTALVCLNMIRMVLEDSLLTGIPGYKSCLEDVWNQPVDETKSAPTLGDYEVIKKLVATLNNGKEAKLLVDFAVNQCDHLQNLRQCISQCWDMAMDRELAASKHDAYMLRAVNYLERYFYLICFGSYLLEERNNQFSRVLFVSWVKNRYGSAIYALLDNLCFDEDVTVATTEPAHFSSMRWRRRRRRKLISRLE